MLPETAYSVDLEPTTHLGAIYFESILLARTYMGRTMQKYVLEHMRAGRAQICLRIRAD